MTIAHVRASSCGFTLIELVISIVVIGVAVSGAMLAIQTTVGRSADPMLQQQAGAIAEAYLEEILTRRFYDPDLPAGPPCPAAEASRDLFDNVCDYRGLDEAGARDQDGNAIAGLAGYRVRVDVDESANLNGLTGSSEVLRIDVRVNRGARVDITLSGYKTRY